VFDFSRWLDDHFGSDESDIVETSNTRTGKNVINVSKYGRTASPITPYSGEYRSIDRSKNVSHQQKVSKHSHSSPQKYTTTATYYVKDSGSPSPRSSPNYASNEYYVRPSSQFREDASVQASLSDEVSSRIFIKSIIWFSQIFKQITFRRIKRLEKYRR